ncbi:hypothetical protein LOC69_13060 [Blastopirellula sp. JC733]|nr:hypothetical protein [Blastopirellula sediminis]
MAAWISKIWNSRVLNVVYERVGPTAIPRLEVVLEDHADVERFCVGPLQYDTRKQNAIATKFLKLIADVPDGTFEVDRLFVIFSAFAPIAREEADNHLTKSDIANLLVRIGNPDLWTINRFSGHATFFFYTEEQVARYKVVGLEEEYAHRYYYLVKPYDEFGYLSLDDYRINFDSKENFDKKFQSSWFYYYR